MGPGDQHLRSAGGSADLHHVHLDVHPFHQLFAGDLFARHQQCLGGFGTGADAQGDVAVPRVDSGDHAGKNLMLLGVKLLINHAALGFAQTLNDDLLAVARGDAAKVRVVHGDVNYVADFILGGNLLASSKGTSLKGST